MIHIYQTLRTPLTACLLFASAFVVHAQEISFPATAAMTSSQTSAAADKEIATIRTTLTKTNGRNGPTRSKTSSGTLKNEIVRNDPGNKSH